MYSKQGIRECRMRGMRPLNSIQYQLVLVPLGCWAHVHNSRVIKYKRKKKKSNNNSCVCLSRHYEKITSVFQMWQFVSFQRVILVRYTSSQRVVLCCTPMCSTTPPHVATSKAPGPFSPVPCPLSLIRSSSTIRLSFHHNQMYRVKHQDHIFWSLVLFGSR